MVVLTVGLVGLMVCFGGAGLVLDFLFGFVFDCVVGLYTCCCVVV